MFEDFPKKAPTILAITLLPKRRGLVIHKNFCPSISDAFKTSSNSDVLSTKNEFRKSASVLQKELCCSNIFPYSHTSFAKSQVLLKTKMASYILDSLFLQYTTILPNGQ